MTPSGQPETDIEWTTIGRPRKTTRYAVAVAVGLVILHVTFAILLRGDTSTGVFFRPADQLAFVGIGIVLAAGVLTLARPRLAVSPAGVRVRNPFTERTFAWHDVHGMSFPDGAAWARLELPDDEFMSVMAVQANDRERAVDSVRSFREAEARYTRE
ncbi:PH domain-containing protein [Rhodococcus rhodnii]|uniref:Low molecular weight protein antigen 6 PH domain-containing protein n=2 Tax=Rhodococcus rhodnii TaxID=38312 RepID=R7WKF7_9NOCA|nr:PH domain-containing protein [Rhodococcus rhodnii]EOM75788.1 hypothetical protein Rrhod_2861 [Rhodococcus rhodnii LMG 5362]TXG91097.1 PH domain-containing protein [Rhodococcus rhodnii]